MASFKYIVTVHEPARHYRTAFDSYTAKPASDIREFMTGQAAAHAIEYARAQHTRPDGTTVTIAKQRLGRYYAQPVGSLSPTGPAQPYRRYEVRDGVVRRVDSK